MAWKCETENLSYGISHQGICPLLKQWRLVAKGKATMESAGLRGGDGGVPEGGGVGGAGGQHDGSAVSRRRG